MQDETTHGDGGPAWRLPKLNPREIGTGALIVVAALFVYLLYAGAHARELSDPQTMDYAQLARHLARGEGFTTSFVRPLSLAKVQNLSHHPDLYHAPLHPLWTSLFFRLGKPTAKMAAWACGAAYLLSLPLVYLLALRLFDRRVAWLALGLYGINHFTLQHAVSGLEVSLATLLVTGLTLAAYLHFRRAEGPAPVTAGLCGALAALCFLTEYIYVILLIPLLVGILLREGRPRWREAGICLAAFLVVFAPWGLRNLQVARNPFYSLEWSALAGDTQTYPGQAVQRSFQGPPNALGFLVTHPREAWRKLRPATLNMHDTLPNLGGAFVAAFFIAGIFVRFRGDAWHRLRLVHYGWILLTGALICLLSADSRLLLPLAPLVIVVGSATFLTLLDTWAERIQSPQRKRRAVGWAIGVLVGVCWYPVLAWTVRLEPESDEAAQKIRTITQTLSDRKVHPTYCDQPWTLAWYGDLDAVWLPQTAADLQAIEAVTGPIRYMVLTPLITTASQQEGLAEWVELYGAATRGVQMPHERFVVADLLGDRGEWAVFRRLPEGAAAGAGR